jgi:hypothetical protein
MAVSVMAAEGYQTGNLSGRRPRTPEQVADEPERLLRDRLPELQRQDPSTRRSEPLMRHNTTFGEHS